MSTVGQMDEATLPRRGRPVNMTARAQLRMLSEVKENPRVSAKDRNLYVFVENLK